MQEVHYKIPWRAAGHYPGHHQSVQKGGGLQFRHHVPLIDAPDPRRFDVRASLRDPFGQIMVRVYQQTSSIPLFVIADLSASMGFTGRRAKIDVLADLVGALGYSAYRTGDSFGFIGCGETVDESLLLAPTLNRAAAADLSERLRAVQPRARHSGGLLDAAERIGGRRALVFLVSDFHFDDAFVERVLATLAVHDVVPVLLWDRGEHDARPGHGLVRVRDDETGRSRLLLMRPSLRRRIDEAFARRRAALGELCLRHGRPPLVLEDGFDADEVTHYFVG